MERLGYEVAAQILSEAMPQTPKGRSGDLGEILATEHTGYWLRMVSNAVSQEFACKVAGEEVTVAEWVFLRALFNDDGLAPTALADRMGMTRGAISKLADRLTAKGLVARSGSATDKRGQSLSLTPEGRERCRYSPGSPI